MQLSKAEYARKSIHNACEVQIENSVTRVTARHHLASLLMPNSYPRDRILNHHLSTIKDSYIPDAPGSNGTNFIYLVKHETRLLTGLYRFGNDSRTPQ